VTQDITEQIYLHLTIASIQQIHNLTQESKVLIKILIFLVRLYKNCKMLMRNSDNEFKN